MKTLVGSPEPPPEPEGHQRLAEAFKRLRVRSVRQVNEMDRWVGKDEDVPGHDQAPEES